MEKDTIFKALQIYYFKKKLWSLKRARMNENRERMGLPPITNGSVKLVKLQNIR